MSRTQIIARRLPDHGGGLRERPLARNYGNAILCHGLFTAQEEERL